MQDVTVAHSPDADDLFLFWALRQGTLPSPGYRFTFTPLDTADLNRAAVERAFDVTAISAALYPEIAETHLILPHGASIGVGYGPRVVCLERCELSSLDGMVIGVPGRSTTAASVLRLIAPSATMVEIPLSPFEGIFTALDEGRIGAALLIHEGQLDADRRQLHTVVDLGKWWLEQTGLPLPVGLNVIDLRLGLTAIEEISGLLRRSIRWALDNTAQLLEPLARWNRERGASVCDRDGIARYLSLYANEDSYRFTPDAVAGLNELVRRVSAGRVEARFAP